MGTRGWVRAHGPGHTHGRAALGDCATVAGVSNLPSAQMALQQSACAARNVRGALAGSSTIANFRFAELGEALTFGEEDASFALEVGEISGIVEILSDKRKGKMTIRVVSDSGIEKDHHVPNDKALLVHAGDFVQAGDPLTEGPLVPHDILKIRGEEALWQYMLDEVQNVSVGVDISGETTVVLTSSCRSRMLGNGLSCPRPRRSRSLGGVAFVAPRSSPADNPGRTRSVRSSRAGSSI